MKAHTRVMAAACVLAVVAVACSDPVKSEFARAKTENSEQSYRQFLKAHPDHALAREAKRALENVVLDTAVLAGDGEALRKFTTEFPDSQRLAEAKAKLEILMLESARKASTIGGYESFLASFPDGAQAGVARSELDVLLQKRIYHWKPKGVLSNDGAKDVRVMEVKGRGLEVTAISNSSHVPATMDLSGGGVQFFVEGLGSRNVEVKINKELGFTTYAGLKFKAAARLDIQKDGTIEVDREGIEALDGKDRHVISRKVTLNGKAAIVMIEQDS